MNDAPDRIYAAAPYLDDDFTPDWGHGAGEWDVSPNWAADHVTYIRADLVDAQDAAWAERVALLQAAVAAARAEGMREAAAIARAQVGRSPYYDGRTSAFRYGLTDGFEAAAQAIQAEASK
jgi:hypothetical protein